MQDSRYTNPTPGASLILSFRLQDRTTLIIGSGRLAASRAFSALEADSKVVVLASGGPGSACEELQWRAGQNQLTLLDWDTLPASSSATDFERDIEALQSFLQNHANISFVCVTDTLIDSPNRRSKVSASRIYEVCKVRGIPINVTDMPDLCDFSFASTHRFEDHTSGERTCLQVGVTTNSKGCRLAGRVRREIVAKLPKEIGAAANNVGRLRALAKASSTGFHSNSGAGVEMEEEVGEDNEEASPNKPVPLRSSAETELESTKRRVRWVAQVSEYWPIPTLSTMSEHDMHNLLSGKNMHHLYSASNDTHYPPSIHSIELPPPPPKMGKIILMGSGPGHPSLLTVAAQNALENMADLVLSDKLVPDAVLALIPSHAELRIARKFPGNADGAQNELMEMAIEAAMRGLTVVRLKQGDPSIFGRAGEEILYFRSHGFEPLVIPGVSSALAGPTFAGIPVTQRGVAESFIVCTGVGRKGKEIQLPGYQRSRTLVILMGVARLGQVVKALTSQEEDAGTRRDGLVYPLHVPIAIVERASMPDQRTILSTLKDIVEALESVGEQRPPGMIVIGWSVLALSGKGDVTVLDEPSDRDEERIIHWLGCGVGWKVEEGLVEGWTGV
ncbi:hypothetical protein APHAL10511_008431 [Amanita phalloides]|nr:hypothetical protein APHAL10511_008431 [Amanita phalloides]